MAKASHWIHSTKHIPSPLHPSKAKSSLSQFHHHHHDNTFRFIPAAAAAKRNHRLLPPLMTKKGSRAPRGLVAISTSSTGKWPGREWSDEYIFTLRDLHLEDLAEDGSKRAEVFINIRLQKHTGFGLSVDGRIITSIGRKCCVCSSVYCSKINTNFRVWVLPEGREDRSTQIPEIGGDDPSVIYVKPGYEAYLDSCIQDAIRLRSSIQETCSETCEKSEPRFQYIGTPMTASLDSRWSRLQELRKSSY
ncbi:hypothetical protein Dimus_010013 [Dionaea muscipula]